MTHLRDDKFLISCAARTGSTMLVQLLRSHPQVVCHGEVFRSDSISALDGRYHGLPAEELGGRLLPYRVQQPAAFLYDVIFDRQTGLAAGFKFKTDEQFLRPWADIAQLVARDRDIKIIRLRRRDLLAQYVSHEVVLRQGVATTLKVGEAPPQVRPFRVDPKTIVAYLDDVARRDRLADEAYSNHRQLQVAYEDLLDDANPARADLLSFLGVTAHPLSTRTVKILGDNASLVTNLPDVMDVLAARGYA
jgi:LPS sulfotransferase NodH